MRIPLTKYGWPQVAVFPAALVAVMVCFLLIGVLFLPAWIIISIEAVLAALLLWALSFFRDPHRVSPSDKCFLLAPADGRITDIETIEEESFIGGRSLRIGIFMSIFNAHINRAPCNVRVEKIAYRKGKYKNAANPQAGRVNESNNLVLVRTGNPKDRLVVRQISGSIARRIVCKTSLGQELTSGEKFGMIKFGSRTELYVPLNTDIKNNVWEPKCLVKIGDKVRAGLTPLVKYEIRKDKEDAKIKNPGS
jgi:phosphatidylserine decarboxylase